jgi:DNA-binding Lrp family transcriptional regulator
VPRRDDLDPTDARLLLALADSPRATVLALAERLGLSRNTVAARLAGLEERGALGTFERRIDPAALGYPLTAFVTVQVVQRLGCWPSRGWSGPRRRWSCGRSSSTGSRRCWGG